MRKLEPPEWETSDKGIRKASIGNVRVLLDKEKLVLWYDEFSDRVWLGDGQLTDNRERNLRYVAQERYSITYRAAAFADMLSQIAYENRRHPLRERLHSLAWDETPRIATFLIDHADADDSEYVRTVTRLWFLAAARRVLEPGVKFDELVILESPQGGLKSSAMEKLALDPDWFTDGMPLGGDPKIAVEQAQGKWIVEFADMHGKSRDNDRLKAFLSRTTDRTRLSYGKRAADYPRWWIPIGTTNDSHYLRDPTGNRRFWPVRIGVFSMDFDPEQLWAEAVACRDEPIRMPKEMWASAGEQQEQRVETDPWEEIIANHVGDAEVISSAELWDFVGVEKQNRKQQDNVRLGAIMRRLGFERKRRRRDGKVVPSYVRGEGARPVKEFDIPF